MLILEFDKPKNPRSLTWKNSSENLQKTLMVIKCVVSQIWLTKSLQLTASIGLDVTGLERDRRQMIGSLQTKTTQLISVASSSHFCRSLPGRAQDRRPDALERGFHEKSVR